MVPGRGWSPMSTAPAGLCDAKAVWTGSEAIFWTPKAGFAFDPKAGTWRALPPAPQGTPDLVAVWTGSEMIVWGGGDRGAGSTFSGSAYDPQRDSWRRIADAPIGLNAGDGVWTGNEMIVFGSSLNGGNHAASRWAVGAAYDPQRDSWRTLPSSQLSPQATSAAWVGDELVAWDYVGKSQLFSTKTWTWGPTIRMPLEPGECYPDSAVVGGQVFAWYCGQAALFDGKRWTKVSGGPLDVQVKAYGSHIDMFRFAEFASAGDVLYVQATGVTVSARGEACYGCAGAPVSFWVFRPGSPDAECLDTHSRVMFDPIVSPQEVAAGKNFTVFGNVPVRGEDGTYRGPSGSIEFWWDLDPEAWVSAVTGTPSPSGSAPAVRLGSVSVDGRCTFGTTFAVPANATQETHPVVAIEHNGRASAAFKPTYVDVPAAASLSPGGKQP